MESSSRLQRVLLVLDLGLDARHPLERRLPALVPGTGIREQSRDLIPSRQVDLAEDPIARRATTLPGKGGPFLDALIFMINTATATGWGSQPVNFAHVPGAEHEGIYQVTKLVTVVSTILMVMA